MNYKLVKILEPMYRSDILVQIVLDGSLLITLLFIIVLEALSIEIRSGCPELFHADNLELVSETVEGLRWRQEAWKGKLESKGLTVKDVNNE